MLVPQLMTPHRWRLLRADELPKFVEHGTISGRMSSKSANFGISMGSSGPRMPGSTLITSRRAGKSLIEAELRAIVDSMRTEDSWICDRCGHRICWDGPPPTRPKPPTGLVQGPHAVFMEGSVNEALGLPEHGNDPVPECDFVFVQSIMNT